MAKVKKNIVMQGLSGSLGKDLYVRTLRDGRTIISVKPDFSNRQFSEAQSNHQKRMKAAAAYAKVASKENPIYAQKAKGTAKNAYNIALADWMNSPVIRSMNLYFGDTIRIDATDDMQVIRVVITILDPQGEPVEQGEAKLELGVWWDYQPTHQGRIQVEAWDLAGNVAQREFDDPWMFHPHLRKTN